MTGLFRRPDLGEPEAHAVLRAGGDPRHEGHGGGAIINLGSISWHLGLKDLALYQTAKAAIEGHDALRPRELWPGWYPGHLHDTGQRPAPRAS